MTKPRQHLHKLFVHLIKLNNHQAFMEMVRLIEDEGRGGEIDWHDQVGERSVASACLGQAQNSTSSASGRKKPEAWEHQRRMARVMMAAGLDLSESGALMDEAIRRGLVYFVAQAIGDGKVVHTPHIEGMLKRIPVSKAVEFMRSWSKDEVMEGICQRSMDYIRKHSWLEKGLGQKTMMEIRRGHSWSSELADQYMRHRLYPDWQNRQYSDKALDIPLDPLLSEDRILLIEKIPAQAWESTLLSGPYKHKDAQMLTILSDRMGKRVERLSIPLPEYGWMEQYLGHRMEEILEKHPPQDCSIELSFARRYIDEMESDQWSWDGVGVALGCLAIATMSSSGESLPQEIDQMRDKIDERVRQHLAGQAPQLDGKNFLIHSLIASRWIKFGEQKTIEEQGLPKWASMGEKDKLSTKRREAFHYSMARAYKHRLENPRHEGPGMPKMASAFWIHLMNSSGVAINRTLGEIMNQGQEGRAGSRVWKVHHQDPQLLDLLQSKEGENFLKSRGKEAKIMRKNALLLLKSALVRGRDEEHQVQMRRPRI